MLKIEIHPLRLFRTLIIYNIYMYSLIIYNCLYAYEQFIYFKKKDRNRMHILFYKDVLRFRVEAKRIGLRIDLTSEDCTGSKIILICFYLFIYLFEPLPPPHRTCSQLLKAGIQHAAFSFHKQNKRPDAYVFVIC